MENSTSKGMVINKEMKRRSDKFILLVAHDPRMGSYLAHCLRKRTPYWIHLVTDTARAFQFSLSLKPDLFVLDLAFPNGSTIDLYERLHAHDEFRHLPAILLRTGSPNLASETKHQQRATVDQHIESLLYTLAELLV